MPDSDDQETLRRFIIRARRVAAHSLTQDREVLHKHTVVQWRGSVGLDGRVTVTRELPEDEESFESLAARVRPLTLATEPIHYSKVLDAIESMLADIEAAREARESVIRLRLAWNQTDVQDAQAHAYFVQSARADGSDATGLVTDQHLATAWMYADLVHADPRGPKREALAFPLVERYAAAVRLYSRFAELTIATLELLTTLHADGTLSVPASAWEDDVVVTVSEFTQEGRAFFAPVGASTPDMRESLEFCNEWSPLTVTDMLRQEASNRVTVVFSDHMDVEIASYDAAVVRRLTTENRLEWEVLVAGCAVFKFALTIADGAIVEGTLEGWDMRDDTNSLRLSSSRLQLELHRSAVMSYLVDGVELFAISTPSFEDSAVLGLQVFAEVSEDIIAIQRLSGHAIEECPNGVDERERVQLRRTRLLWEGQVVQYLPYPVTVTVPAPQPPAIIVNSATTIVIDGATVPVPTIYLRHPRMTATAVVGIPGDEQLRYTVAPPPGGRFLAWSPAHVNITPDDDLVASTVWGLVGIDESNCPY